MRVTVLSTAAIAAALLVAVPGFPQRAAAQPAASMGPDRVSQAAMRRCRRELPVARRFVGLPRTAVQARYRAPRGIIVRYCAICTRDFRPNRLTFGLDERGIVRGVSCG